MNKMHVIKRDGRKEEVLFDKITSRVDKQCYGLNMTFIDPALIAISVVEGIYSGIHTRQLDILAAEIAFTHTCYHPDYETLAGRLVVSNLHKETKKQFSDVMGDLYNAIVESTGEKLNVISNELYEIVNKNADYLNSCIIHHRDFNYSYFGFNTLEKSYLLRINGKIVERPQHMLMRVSLGIHGNDIEKAIETYDLMSQGYFTHASPTLFTSGTNRAQMASCFLLTMGNDERHTIMGTLKKCAMISKCAGGIGLSVSVCRKKGQLMKPRHIQSLGLIKNLRIFNVTAQYVDQGGNKRPGAIAIYLEPWHAEIFDFLNLRKNDGEKEMRCRDLFLALWIPDLFMKRVEADEDWSLMCPSECPGLNECWGTEFEELYCKYEKEGNFVKKVKANDLFQQILIAQLETGNPFMLYKDACNRKSNQQNLGTIKSSNLCTEIVEYCSDDEIAVCNLASIAVNKFVNVSSKKYDFEQLKSVTKFVTKNLNKIIDRNFYPLPETERSNKRHRPIGIGIQGLADAFALLHYPFESSEARLLNQQIFETLYYGALEASCELAHEFGTYDTYKGSPVSRGILQYDMWNKTPTNLWDWAELKKKIAQFGVRNSLLIAPMPTASTSQILGNNESFEPFKYMYYARNVLAGEYLILNRYLVKDLIDIGLWNPEIMDKIILNYGSIQKITEIPENIRKLYKTVWEMSIKTLMDMAADRGAFIDQSQSFTIFFNKSDLNALREIHLYGWKLGLKTGMYYLRNEAGINPQQFDMKNKDELKTLICSLTNKDECTMCSS